MHTPRAAADRNHHRYYRLAGYAAQPVTVLKFQARQADPRRVPERTADSQSTCQSTGGVSIPERARALERRNSRPTLTQFFGDALGINGAFICLYQSARLRRCRATRASQALLQEVAGDGGSMKQKYRSLAALA